LPIAKLLGGYHVLSGGERGPPSPIDQPGVPPDVIKMQMRIDDEIDFVRFHTGAPQPVKEIRMHVVPASDGGAPLPIAEHPDQR
jgi:hypothetical protein